MRVMFTAVCFVFLGLAGVFVNLISFEVNNYRFYICLATASITLVSVTYFYFLESPFHLYRRREVGRLFQCLLTMARRNHSKKDFPGIKSKLQAALLYGESSELCPKGECGRSTRGFPVQSTLYNSVDSIATRSTALSPCASSRPSSRSWLELFRTISLGDWKKILKLLVLYTQTQLVYNAGLLLNKDLGLSSVYVSGSLLAGFQALGYLAGVFVIPVLGRTTVNKVSCASLSALSLVILAVDFLSNSFDSYSQRSQSVRLFETGEPDECWGLCWCSRTVSTWASSTCTPQSSSGRRPGASRLPLSGPPGKWWAGPRPI